MDHNPIPLSQRLSSMQRLGFSDPTVLPLMIKAWGNTPVEEFFTYEDDLNTAMRRLRFTQEMEVLPVYGRMVQRLFNRWTYGNPDSLKRIASDILNMLARGLDDLAKMERLDFLHVSLLALAEEMDRLAGEQYFQDYVRNEILPHFAEEDWDTIQLHDALSNAMRLPGDQRDKILCTLFLEPFTKIQWKEI